MIYGSTYNKKEIYTHLYVMIYPADYMYNHSQVDMFLVCTQTCFLRRP